MLNGNSEAAWATLWKPGVSSNQLPHIRNMRTDFQKSTPQSWCEYQGKEQLEIHIMLTEWFSQSWRSIFVSWRCCRASLIFVLPPPLCECHSIYARHAWLLAVARERAGKD